MRESQKPSLDDKRLHEIAALMRLSFTLPTRDISCAKGELDIPDMLLAFDSPALREIMIEIKALHQEQADRLKRLLSRHADNDTGD